LRNPVLTRLERWPTIEEKPVVFSELVHRVRAAATGVVARLGAVVRAATRPNSMVVGMLADATRTRGELIAENALLRQQLIVAARSVERPRFVAHERGIVVLLSRFLPWWRDAVLLVKPETLLRWHRDGFRLLWRRRSKRKNRKPNLSVEAMVLIRRIAEENRLWGAERIRGELLKVGIRVAKRTVQRYVRGVRSRPPEGQRWATFLANHRHEIWACDFLQVYDLWFDRSLPSSSSSTAHARCCRSGSRASRVVGG
jgi:hypothetical protein